MKNRKKHFMVLVVLFVLIFIITGCKGNSSMSETFPNIKSTDIPEILDKSVGTVGDTYFTSGDSSKDNDYTTYLKVVFEDTNEADYNELVEYYQTASIENIKDDMLFYDWGSLKVLSENNSISVEAWIN